MCKHAVVIIVITNFLQFPPTDTFDRVGWACLLLTLLMLPDQTWIMLHPPHVFKRTINSPSLECVFCCKKKEIRLPFNSNHISDYHFPPLTSVVRIFPYRFPRTSREFFLTSHNIFNPCVQDTDSLGIGAGEEKRQEIPCRGNIRRIRRFY